MLLIVVKPRYYVYIPMARHFNNELHLTVNARNVAALDRCPIKAENEGLVRL